MANLSNINNKFLVTTGGNVLIGQTSAIGSSIFQVTGNATFSGSINAGQRIKIGTGGTYEAGSIYSDSNYGMIFRALQASPSTADFLFTNSANVARLTIDSSGNVLIGIASTYPQGDNTILKLYSPSVPRFYLQNTTTGSNTTDGSQIYVSGSDLYITNSESANTIFSTNSLEKMRIDSSGNVGIGVTPSTIWSSSYDALQIGLGGSVYAHNSAGNALKLGSNIVYEGTAPNYYDKYLTSSTATKYEQDAGSHIWSTAASGTAGGVVSWSERMRIDSSGNVGIGVTNPSDYYFTANDLVLGGNANNGMTIASTNVGAIHFADGSTGAAEYAGYIAYQHSDNKMRFGVNESDKLVILSGGNVGIGVTSPVTKLNVAGNIAITATKAYRMYNAANNGWGEMSFIEADNRIQFNRGIQNSGTDFRLTENSANSFVCANEGNFGIGTTGPGALLHVKAPDGTIGSMILGGGNNPVTAVGQINTELNFGSNDGSAVPFGGSIKTVTEFSNGAFVGMAFYTCQQGRSPTLAEAMRITNAGSLIVGTATVAAANAAADNFVIKGEGAAVGLTISQASNSGTGTIFFGDVASSAAGGFRYNHNTGDMAVSFEDDITFSNNGGERMRITSNGTFLVNQTVPNTTADGFGIHPTGSGGGNLVSCHNGTAGAALIVGHGAFDGTIVDFRRASVQVGTISVSTSATQYNTSSDYRLKEDLQDFTGLDMVSKIPVYDFKWKSDESRSYGVMAHELQEVLPDAVTGDKDAEEMQGVDYSKIVPLLVKSIQELKAEIELLKSK